ncbi:MAG TPA: hypothetical protein VKA84_14910, partial [Gemmatimonadaceae bacterium]|nr:hypothetical protein [Gemmatimonadaceae bacterium]
MRPMRHTIVALSLLAASAPLAPAAAQVPPAGGAARPDTTRRDTTRRTAADSARGAGLAGAMPLVTPTADQARGVDAEIRVALYELMNGSYVPALGRLRWLDQSPVALTDASASGVLRGRTELRFLLAQAYYRLGMDSAFRNTATALVSAGAAPRYAGILQAQLLLEAYRHGQYARVSELARSLNQSELRGLASLVAGLASYQSGSYADARTQFATAQQAGGAYAPYAQYMDALAQLRGDTAQTAPALAALAQLASAQGGEFGDQIRLTAAQLAYEANQFDQAAQLAGGVNPTGGLGAQALLVRAWAQYKAGQVDAAGGSFAEFARRYPQLPERDESQLMYAQTLLQRNQTDQAGRVFRQVADSMKTEASALQARASGTMGEAARALVLARAAGLLFINDPANGKTVALEDAPGSDVPMLAVIVSDSVPAGLQVTSPEVISLSDVAQRFGGVGAPLNSAAFPQRVLYSQTSATRTRGDYYGVAQSLYDADVAVALARYRLQEQLDALARQLRVLGALQQQIADDAQRFGQIAQQLQMTRDSLAKLETVLEANAQSVRELFTGRIRATRLLAQENAGLLDSVQRTLGGTLSGSEQEMMQTEASTARTYGEIADLIERGLNGAIQRHPAFVLRDSIRTRGDRMRGLLGEVQQVVASTQALLAAEFARLQGLESQQTGGLRGALAAAEAARNAAEARVIAVVERELTARSGEMLAGLRRDTEAADFGSASAAFFQALEAGRATTGGGATGDASGSGAGSGGTAGGAGGSSGGTTSSSGSANRPAASTGAPAGAGGG